MAFTLTSTAFKNKALIPVEFTADGADVSPKLRWSNPPPGTQSFALVLEDRDAKAKSIHWLLWNIAPSVRSLPEGLPKVAELPDKSRQGLNDFQQIGYNGPRLARVSKHTYRFTIYALSSVLPLAGGSNHEQLKASIQRPLGEAHLVGCFKPDRDAARTRALENDKQYISLRDEFEQRLVQAHRDSPAEVANFFTKFLVPSQLNDEEIRTDLNTITNQSVRRTLEDYMRFAKRFRVIFRFNRSTGTFRLQVLPSEGVKFHVRIVGDHLEPVESLPIDEDDPLRDHFSDNQLTILSEAQNLVNDGHATFTQIDDGPGYSMLKDLLSFAYKDDGAAFFFHNSDQPSLGCVFGEKMSKDLLAAMGKPVTEFQKVHFERSSGGRPPNMDRLKETLAIDREPIPNIEKAAELAKGGDEKEVKAKEVELSKLHRKKRKRKK
jgi:hypothetical protein